MNKVLPFLITSLFAMLLWGCERLDIEEIGSTPIPQDYIVVDAVFQNNEHGKKQAEILIRHNRNEQKYQLLTTEKNFYLDLLDYQWGDRSGEFLCYGYYRPGKLGVFNASGMRLVEDANRVVISENGEDYFHTIYRGGKYRYYWNGEFMTYGFSVITGAFRPNGESLILAVTDRKEDMYKAIFYEFEKGKTRPKRLGSFYLPQDGLDPREIHPYDVDTFSFEFRDDHSFVVHYQYIYDKQGYWGAISEENLKEVNLEGFFNHNTQYQDTRLYHYEEGSLEILGESHTVGTLLNFDFSIETQKYTLAYLDSISWSIMALSHGTTLTIKDQNSVLFEQKLEAQFQGSSQLYQNYTSISISQNEARQLGLRVSLEEMDGIPAYGYSIPLDDYKSEAMLHWGDLQWKRFARADFIHTIQGETLYVLRHSLGESYIAINELRSPWGYDEVYDAFRDDQGNTQCLVLEESSILQIKVN